MMEQAGCLTRNLWIAAAACAAALILSSCASRPVMPEAAVSPSAPDRTLAAEIPTDTDLSRLEGTFWRLVRLDGSGRAPSDTILHFSRETVDLSEPFRATSFRLRVESLVRPSWWERIGPAGNGNRVDALFERSLAGSVRYRIDGERLSFLDRAGRALVMADFIHSRGPENRDWLIVRYRRDGELVQPSSAVQPRVLLLNGVLEGSPGCGRFTGGYRRSGGRLEISTAWLVLGPCDQTDFAVQNDAVGKAVGGRRQAEVSGDRMLLKDEDGVVQVELIAAPVPALSTIASWRPSGG